MKGRQAGKADAQGAAGKLCSCHHTNLMSQFTVAPAHLFDPVQVSHGMMGRFLSRGQKVEVQGEHNFMNRIIWLLKVQRCQESIVKCKLILVQNNGLHTIV